MEELDKLDDRQTVLMALAVWDLKKFNNTRIFRLKSEYGITTDVNTIYKYYHTENFAQENHDNYIRLYKQYLQALVYA